MKETIRWGIVMLCVACTADSFAQVRDNARAELNLAFGAPLGEFADDVGGLGIGVSALFGGRIPNSSVTLGTELGILNYGRAEQLQIFSLIDVPVEVLDIATSANIFLGHLVARLQPTRGVFLPYVEGLAGLKYLSTRTAVEGDFIIDHVDYEEGFVLNGWHDADNNFDAVAKVNDWAFSVGGGIGLDLALYSGPIGFEGEPGSVAFNLGVRYLFGTEAKFISHDDIRRLDEGQFLLDVDDTRTDLIMPTAGVRVRF